MVFSFRLSDFPGAYFDTYSVTLVEYELCMNYITIVSTSDCFISISYYYFKWNWKNKKISCLHKKERKLWTVSQTGGLFPALTQL